MTSKKIAGNFVVEIINVELTRTYCQPKNDRIFFYEDNLYDQLLLNNTPTKTHAAIRNLKNAVPIITRNDRWDTNSSYYYDEDLQTFIAHFFTQLGKGAEMSDHLVFHNSFGNTFKHKAPSIYHFVKHQLQFLSSWKEKP